ncbi:MAG TPA: hypothetical protein VF099_10015, partial [Ktedonobacterales bacterium]
YDGLAIARAVVEHLHNVVEARTLFATHYHELAGLAAILSSLRAYTIAINEQAEEIVFLHRILPGSGGRSYGIQVARLAGMPTSIIQRAREVLVQIEQAPLESMPESRLALVAETPAAYEPAHTVQVSAADSANDAANALQQHPALPAVLLDSSASAFIQELLALNVAAITPLEAINRLFALQQQARALLVEHATRSNNSH